MPTDKFTKSVPPNTPTNLAADRVWRNVGSIIHRIQVVAPDAATNLKWTLQDGSDVPFKDQDKLGSAFNFDFNAFLDVEMAAEREWQLIVEHKGTTAQDVGVIVEWD
jgi:hypothetical protein